MRAIQRRSLSPTLAMHLLCSIAPLYSSKGNRKHLSLRRRAGGEQGLTLIECLVAIIVITITIVAITPPIMLATATRIQSRRAEQANQAAQGEIDRIRFIVERGGYTLNDLPASAAVVQIKDAGVAVGPPTGSTPLLTRRTTCTGTYAANPRYPTTPAPSATGLILVDVDGDCTPDFVMQVFRNIGQVPPPANATDPPYAFDMGVRVYTFIPGQPFPTLQKERASLVAGTGARDQLTGNSRRPLAVLYSSMARNDQSKSLGQICKQANGNCTY